MRVPAYHSSNPTDPDVHHIYDDCVSGSQIPPRNRVDGTETTASVITAAPADALAGRLPVGRRSAGQRTCTP